MQYDRTVLVYKQGHGPRFESVDSAEKRDTNA